MHKADTRTRVARQHTCELLHTHVAKYNETNALTKNTRCVCIHVACIHVIIRLFVKPSFIIVGFHRSRVCARGRWMAQRGAYTEAQAVMFYIHNACIYV